jgi:two-component system sensor histidine kinase CiaH
MFRKARIKLTLWYLLIIMLISLCFSFVIYQLISHELTRFAGFNSQRLERRLNESHLAPQPPIFNLNDDLIQETKNRLLLQLVIINTSILLISGGFGYLLAGRTLLPLQDNMDSQNQFISDASHELRTPLTSLRTSLEVYLRNKHPNLSLSRQTISDSLDEVKSIQSLSDHLLQLSQAEKSITSDYFQKVHLAKIITNSIEKINHIASVNKLIIKNQVTDCSFDGNPDTLQELFINLLDNAAKYSSPGKTITISSQNEKGLVQVKVVDQGIGISDSDLPHIFDRFYRSDSARSKKDSDGYGLGLAIAQKIAWAHHGSITVDSHPGKGSTFTIRLPSSQKPNIFS